jgi:hypothetical protein
VKGYKDTRPRLKYVMPDGRPITVIGAKDKAPEEVITVELRQDDPLWHKAQPSPHGGTRRIVHATLAVGL